MTGYSRTDLRRWTAELATKWGLQGVGFHLIVWGHDPWCSHHPHHLEQCPGDRCYCQPNATVVLHVGTPHERLVDLVRYGIALPVRTLDDEMTAGSSRRPGAESRLRRDTDRPEGRVDPRSPRVPGSRVSKRGARQCRSSR